MSLARHLKVNTRTGIRATVSGPWQLKCLRAGVGLTEYWTYENEADTVIIYGTTPRITAELLFILDHGISLFTATFRSCPSFHTLVSVVIRSSQQ